MDTTHGTLDAPKPRGRPRKVTAQVLSEHELAGLFAEAWWAFDMAMSECVRFDTKGRRWAFTLDKVNGVEMLDMRVTGGGQERRETLTADYLRSDIGKALIEDAVRSLDKVSA